MHRPKISMVIPTYTINKELEETTILGIATYLDQVDEMIVVEDGGMFSPKILQVVDHYLYNKDNVGFTKNLNRGWRYASGEYVMLVNSDTSLMTGKLDDLCVPETVTSPFIASQYVPRLAGSFFVVPDSVRKERGMLLEDMVMYSSDSEYDNRVKDIFKAIADVRIFHEITKTIDASGIDQSAAQKTDNAIYKKLVDEGKAAA